MMQPDIKTPFDRRCGTTLAKRSAVRLVLVIGLLSLSIPGCIELRALLGDTPTSQDGSTDGSAGTGGGDSGPSTGNTGLATVRLRVSNVTPEIDEQVTFTCEVESGSTDGVRFDFTSILGRLVIDRERGTARFIVEQTDLGVTYSFTCSATNGFGTGPRSSSVLVTPTSLAPTSSTPP